MARKQLLYQESILSVLIGRIFQNLQQAFKNLEVMLGPDIEGKYVITFFLLPPPEEQPPAFLLFFSLQHYFQPILDIRRK